MQAVFWNFQLLILLLSCHKTSKGHFLKISSLVWKLLTIRLYPLLERKHLQEKHTSERCVVKSYRIDFIESLPSFITFAANPMSVEVGTDPIQHFAWKPVVFPLLSVELKYTLIRPIFLSIVPHALSGKTLWIVLSLPLSIFIIPFLSSSL